MCRNPSAEGLTVSKNKGVRVVFPCFAAEISTRKYAPLILAPHPLYKSLTLPLDFVYIVNRNFVVVSVALEVV